MVRTALNSVRFSTLVASLATRGAGFIASLLIARLAGASALGTYSALVNTAASVATPFAQILTNNSTVTGAESSRSGGDDYRLKAQASFLLALLLSAVSAVALLLLYEFTLGSDASPSPVVLTVGMFVVIAQVLGAVGLGFLYGAGEFMLASRISFLAALVLCLAAYPAIQNYGLNGALCLLLLSSVLPPALMGLRVLTRDCSLGNTTESLPEAWQQVKSQFVRSLPSVAAITVNNGVNWICTIYLVQSVYGAAGVGIVAVAAQWLNLMLIPATSWGGVSLKALSDAIASGREKTAWRVSSGLMRKNFLVTLLLAGLIALASGLIARAYGLSDTDVALLICVNAACALVASINNVFERFLLALDRQAWWLFFSFASVSFQLILTWLFIAKGLWVVAGGVFVAGVILLILSYSGVSRALPLQMKAQA